MSVASNSKHRIMSLGRACVFELVLNIMFIRSAVFFGMKFPKAVTLLLMGGIRHHVFFKVFYVIILDANTIFPSM